jgi:hypothetical protein
MGEAMSEFRVGDIVSLEGTISRINYPSEGVTRFQVELRVDNIDTVEVFCQESRMRLVRPRQILVGDVVNHVNSIRDSKFTVLAFDDKYAWVHRHEDNERMTVEKSYLRLVR